MKVLFDARIHLNYYSGISRYIISFLKAYLSQFQQDEVIVLYNPSIQNTNSLFTELNGFKNVSFLKIDLAHMGPVNYLKMGRIIQRIKPDVYHYPHLDTPVFTGEIPIVATVHDANLSKDVKKFDDRFGLKKTYFKQALKTTLKKADRIIFVSESVKNELLEGSKNKTGDKFKVIHNGLEENFNQINIDANFESLGIKKPFLFYVGQIRTHKNVPRIIAAFEEFQKENAEYSLVLVGHNYLNKDLNNGNILHIEKVDNTTLKLLYANCKAFVFPSLFEGFGLPIIEALSFGKPVVTSNIGATKEIGQSYAHLVDPYSTTGILTGIRAAVNESEIEEKRIAYATSFDWKENARKVRLIYLEAIAAKK